MAGAHDVPPPLTVAQNVPAQHSAAATSQGSPICRQTGAALPASGDGRQTVLPGSPPQTPAQQSREPWQGAPAGAHEPRQ
jgi:hypothetical protein